MCTMNYLKHERLCCRWYNGIQCRAFILLHKRIEPNDGWACANHIMCLYTYFPHLAPTSCCVWKSLKQTCFFCVYVCMDDLTHSLLSQTRTEAMWVDKMSQTMSLRCLKLWHLIYSYTLLPTATSSVDLSTLTSTGTSSTKLKSVKWKCGSNNIIIHFSASQHNTSYTCNLALDVQMH